MWGRLAVDIVEALSFEVSQCNTRTLKRTVMK